jgi:glycosyltransferase involved in cell wall biosynthesis
MVTQIGSILCIALALFATISLFYYLFFFIRLAIYKSKERQAPSKFFSIIICARNEEHNLRANLPTWLNQNYHNAQGEPMYEVLLVDDNSDDGSSYLFQDFVPHYPHLRILTLRQEAKGIRGKKFPLSMGIKEAKYEHLLLTDADCIPSSENWLAAMASNHTDEKVIVLGYAPYQKLPGFLNKWIRWETLHSAIQYLSYALAGLPYMGVGRNLSYVKPLFNENKGFSGHNHLMSGDDDLFINKVATAKNTTICIDPDAYLVSKPKTSFENWWIQKGRHLSTGRFYKAGDKFFLGLYSFTHFAFWILFFALLAFPKFYIYTFSVFFVRWIVQILAIGFCAKKLGEKDLISSIWLFDILTLWYNLRMLPSVFKKNDKWN